MRLSSAHFEGTASQRVPASFRRPAEPRNGRTPSVRPPPGALPSGHSRGVLVRIRRATGANRRPPHRSPEPGPVCSGRCCLRGCQSLPLLQRSPADVRERTRRELHRRGQKLVRKLLQGHHDERGPGQAAGPAEDASGVECSARREHDSHAETTSGTMQVVGLGCARRGHNGLHPLDAALNLLPERSLVDMRRHVTIATASRAPPRTPWKPQVVLDIIHVAAAMRRAVLVASSLKGLSAFGPRPDGSRPGPQ